jgi:hypothetical protein
LQLFNLRATQAVNTLLLHLLLLLLLLLLTSMQLELTMLSSSCLLVFKEGTNTAPSWLSGACNVM